jgi:Ca2+-transporting ATPase
MLLTTLSLFHVVAGLLARDQLNTIFSHDAWPSAKQMRRYGFALIAIIAATSIGFLQRIIGMTSLTFAQWWICIGIALTLVAVEEIIKFFIRRRDRDAGTVAEPALAEPVPAAA